MNRLLIALVLIICPLVLDAQSYNPYVSGADVSPKPIWPVEAGGTGTLSFNIGNTGSDPLIVYSGNQITLTFTISNGEPDNADPLQALGGTSRSLFDWTYNSVTKPCKFSRYNNNCLQGYSKFNIRYTTEWFKCKSDTCSLPDDKQFDER
jgi:hypothetical protein